MFGRYYPQLFILLLGARLRPPRLGYGRGWPDPWELETRGHLSLCWEGWTLPSWGGSLTPELQRSNQPLGGAGGLPWEKEELVGGGPLPHQ